MNPINEGLTVIYLTAIFSGLAGNDIWRQKSPVMNLAYNNLLIYFALVIIIANNIYRLPEQHEEHEPPEDF